MQTNHLLELNRIRLKELDPEILLPLAQVKIMTGLSKSTIYLKIKNGEFPKPVAVGLRGKRWRMSDTQRWIQSCQ